MSTELDCRNMECPGPVLHVRKALEGGSPIKVVVVVDNEAARQNVSRFLEHQNYLVTSNEQGSDFRVFGTKGEGEVPSHNQNSPTPSADHASVSNKKIMVLITSAHLGHGDDGLGDMLMFNYIKTLKEMGPDLWRVYFVNTGVNFTAEGSEAVPILQELTQNGVQVFACGACLAYFHILDKIQVGEVTNMLEIVTSMRNADSVITI